MGWLFEDSTTVLLAGALVEVLLGVVLYHTQRAKVLLAMAAVLAIVLLCVTIELAVVTPREQVEIVLYEAARAIEANDTARVLAHIAPEATEMRSLARANLQRWTVTEARITDLDVTVDSHAVPPTATAELIGRASVDDPQNKLPYRNTLQRFRVCLRRDGDTWRMVSYTQAALNEPP